MIASTAFETELMMRLQKSDADAFNQLFGLYARPLLRIAYNKIRSKEVAEELVHDVFLKFWLKREGIAIHTGVFAYLHGMLRNQILMYLRSQPSIDCFVDQILAANIASDQSAEQQIIVQDLEHFIEAQVEHLPEKCREIFRLSRYQHYSIAEIAQILDLSPQTVKNQLSKALSILRLQVKEAILLLFFFWPN